MNGSTRRPQARIRIVIVDDHPIALAGLEALLSGERDLGVVARCVDGYEAVRAVTAHQPDVLVVDQDMPVMDGVALLKHLRTAGDPTPVVLLATANNQKMTEALGLDVQGVVFKHSDPRQLIRCLREVGAGRRWLDSSLNSYPDVVADGQVLDSLTRRQIEVARAAVSGLSNKELAQRLGVSEGTIKNHLHAIYERLRLDGRLALLLYLKEKALA
jgi:two-component system nitrate/nitrite response regulator NarL